MKLGVDLSIMDELNKLGPKFYYEGKEIEPFHFFAEHSNISVVRLRLWNDPYDDKGNPYGGGTNDLTSFLRMAKKAQEEGMMVMLDFHYSDFWVDPHRQKLPKAWENLKNYDEAKETLYRFTLDTLKTIKENGIDLYAIQVGNEITHGMVWPYGETEREFDPINGGGFIGHCGLLKEGIRACKEVFPKAKTILHLEHSGSYDMQDWYFSKILEQNVEFDVIGESYYPYWHGPFPLFEDCISRLKEKYQKEIWILELGYQFMPTVDPDYSEVTDAKEGDFIVGNVNGRIPFEQSKQGQANYIAMMLKICKNLGIGLICYWEPTWMHKPAIPWADLPGQAYCDLIPEPAGNSWDVETFFDYDGNANPVIDIFTQQFVDNIK